MDPRTIIHKTSTVAVGYCKENERTKVWKWVWTPKKWISHVNNNNNNSNNNGDDNNSS